MNSRNKDPKKLLADRIHRLKGQLDGIERMINNDSAPKDVLVQLQASISGMVGVKNNYSKYLLLNSSLVDIREIVDLFLN